MWSSFNDQIKGMFPSIWLTELNATASFLDRIDTKYVVTEQKFLDIIGDMKEDFFVLEIAGKSVFEYDSVYMDTEEYEFYFNHQNKTPLRSKIRTRKYIDSDIAFLEYKQKQGSLLRKFRYEIDTKDHGSMTEAAEKFCEEIHTSFYPEEKLKKIFPSLITHCNRLTLCSKDSSERVTIDFNIWTEDLRETKMKKDFHNTVIIESKASTIDGKSAKIMEKNKVKKASGCSKYCIGLLYTGIFKNRGKFENTMKQIDAMS